MRGGAPGDVLTADLVGGAVRRGRAIWSRGRWHDRLEVPACAAAFPSSVLSFVGDGRRGARGAVRRLDAALSSAQVFSTSLPFADNVDAQIFFLARLPRTLAAALVGGTLAAAGVVFQGLLQNPLATPYTLGVSAGASLGAMIAITFGAALADRRRRPAASLAGACIAVLIVYALATARHRGLSTTVLLLAGVTLNAFFSALILFVQYLSDFAQTLPRAAVAHGRSRRRRLRARSSRRCRSSSRRFAAFAWLARPLNLLSLGAEAADEPRARYVGAPSASRSSAASLATGAAVSVGGPIGFVGIIVPHLVRLLVGADHRARAAGVDVLRRGVSRRLRRGRAHRHRAARIAGRHHHRGHWRTVLSVAALETTMSGRLRASRLAARGGVGALRLCGLGLVRPSVLSAVTRPCTGRRGSSVSFRQSRRCSSRSARATRSSACRAYDTYPPEAAKKARVGALLNPDFERILSLKPDLVVVYVSQTDLIGACSACGVPTFVYRHAGLADVGTTIASLGERVGRGTGSVALVRDDQHATSKRCASQSQGGRGRASRWSSAGKPGRFATSSSARASGSSTTSSKRPAVRMRSPM